jgi:hypothetical protein
MKELLDARNQSLWDDINQKFNVKIEHSYSGNYGCFSQNDNVTFYINPSNLCKDSFTHELLHVYLRLKEFYIGASLTNTIGASKILSANLSDKLLEHIGNCLDHVKMLPLFLEMGFNRKKIIVDYDLYKGTPEEILEFKRFYRNGKRINVNLIDPYIGRIVSMLADPNDLFDYSHDLIRLKQIDPQLYQNIERLINHWKEVKIQERNIWDDNDTTVTFNFYQNIKTWISNNKIN